MKKLALLAILLVSASAFAQSNSFSLSLLQPQFSGGSVSVDGQRVGISMKSRTGFGIGYTRHFSGWSMTFDARQFRAPGTAGFTSSVRSQIGTFDIQPITAVVHYERGPLFIGGGAAFVRTGPLHSADLQSMGIGTVAISDDVTYVVDGGFVLPVRGPVGVAIEARYMPVSVDAVAQARKATLKFDALTAGVSLRWKF